MAAKCPLCSNTKNVKIADHGRKRLFRFLSNNNRYSCEKCNITWRKKAPENWQSIENKSLSDAQFMG